MQGFKTVSKWICILYDAMGWGGVVGDPQFFLTAVRHYTAVLWQRKQLLKIKFLVNEQNVSVMCIDINAISLCLDLNIIQ